MRFFRSFIFCPSFLLASLPIGNALPSSSLYADLLAQVQSQLGKSNQKMDILGLGSPVDVTGDHAFVAPDFDAGDQRGPCPAINALANHGYISHDGVTGLVEAVVAIVEVFNMEIELALILAVLGTVWAGDVLSLNPGFSIGGYSDKAEDILDNLGGLLGTPRGLTGSHNIIESDSSNTRDDYYLTGDASTLQMSLFEEFYAMSNSIEGDYNYDLMGLRASKRWHESVAQNPNFYYGPVTGLFIRNAGFAFPRLWRNHSIANPEGTLTKEILKSILAISGEEGNLTYTRGHERLPENWYHSPVPWGLVGFNLDLNPWLLEYPELISIGGNTGTVNSFTGVDVGNLTGGVLNLETLLEGNNLLCFVFEIVKFAAPNALSSIFSVIDVPLQLITDALAQPLLNLSCPAFEDLQTGGKNWFEYIADIYPGANITS